MSKLKWDETGERLYETGLDHGILYIMSGNGAYSDGIAWNGLISVTESPTGAEATPLYADNIKYLNLIAAEDFGATIEAYSYPSEFRQCDGNVIPIPGVTMGQQARKTFGLCYRTKMGNDIQGDEYGYKLHLIYCALAAPSERAYQTINDSPEAITFSWTITTTPIAVPDKKPTSCISIDSTKTDPELFKLLEDLICGRDAIPGDIRHAPVPEITPHLPSPDAVVEIIETGSLYRSVYETLRDSSGQPILDSAGDSIQARRMELIA